MSSESPDNNTDDGVFISLFGETLTNGEEDVQTSTALADVDAVGIYFSAHWCPPCRGFTPILGKKYEALKAAGKKVEIVFVSSDRDEKTFKEYHETMPFLALPFDKRDIKQKLSKKYSVRGIPTLVFIDGKSSKIITTEGRGSVSAKSFVEDFPYHPKPVNDLSATGSGLNDKRALILFTDTCEPEVAKSAHAALQEFAEEEFKKDEDDRKGAQRFFTAKGEGGPIAQIRSGCKLPVVVKKHEHELNKLVGQSSGTYQRWYCDGCGKDGAKATSRFKCAAGCNFDFCDECEKIAGAELNAEDKQPSLVLLNLGGDAGAYYVAALPDSGTFDRAAIQKFSEDFVAGALERRQWGE